VPAAEQLLFLRFKERRFGRGCIDQWSGQRDALLAQLEARLQPFESMLVHRPFLLGDRPRFVDLDLASKIYC
jgi:glutathione S-transferase